MNGHDHNYQRFPPVNGTTYIVSGGGGATLYPVGDCPADTPDPVAWNDDVHGFLYISATPAELVGTAISASGPRPRRVLGGDGIRTYAVCMTRRMELRARLRRWTTIG